ncbi:MAG: (d)CMP kinase [Gammaproteobacteria bacterium]|jgi:cytidylate kinase|nr:(d)CMP kinase [Gammaproteobacteria bacterium]MBT3489635.1 (d)CMP kinase [Gammaproteobacteria bacterium]MBT3718473.1 (d)CMP kinase [Gammaproteobacteria bacterium]MBT3843928.1 (d)CMP kinase [Gammaproteobacteria bacterium]MBT3893448.1 (d)CMP kinase [Gammaproteobacteria bacterium]
MTAGVITIDGPGGAGKGTVSLAVAHQLGWGYLDSGALYRVLGLSAVRKQIAFENEAAVAAEAARLGVSFGADDPNLGVRVLLDGEEVTQEIRTEQAGKTASQVAALPAVRTALLQRQRDFEQPPGVVADGRDMGTTVFPHAGLKIFLTASAEERAKRRYKQLIKKGDDANIRALQQEIEARDRMDSERSASPLKAADDAITLDTTLMSIDDVVSTVLAMAAERGLSAE